MDNPIVMGALVFLGVLLASLPLLRIVVKRTIAKTAEEAQARLLAEQAQTQTRDPLLASLEVGKPALVYFTSKNCVPCKTTQSPILAQLRQEWGERYQQITVMIDDQLEDALRWGVMKVPRIIVLDPQLRPYASNLEVTQLATLKQQLTEASHVQTP